MFSGIVEETARVSGIQNQADAYRLGVTSGLDHHDTKVGDSIAVEGVCLTVVQKTGPDLIFDVSPETLRRSTLGELGEGSPVNLERSLQVGSRVHGHFVYGHVDTTVSLISRTAEKDSIKMVWSLPEGEKGFLAAKASVALAGVSLTVGEVDPNSFSVYLIPHTLEVTTLGQVKTGQRVNLEVDILARYVQSVFLNGQGADLSASRVTLEFLKEHGYVGE